MSEKTCTQSRKKILIFIFLILSIISVLLSLSLGSVKISLTGIFTVLSGNGTGINEQIIWNIRLPRTIVAALVGMSLAISGGILQGIMRNPLASPNIIGVSSGAGFAGIVLLILFPENIGLLVPFAFLGAMVTTVMIYTIAWRGGSDPHRLILTGVGVSAFLGAGIQSLMIFFPDRVHNVIGFMVGGLAARSWHHVSILAPYAIIGACLSYIMAKRLNILMMGDETAKSLGLSVERTRLVLITISSILAAASVSIVGLLGFVGLIVPHIARMFVGSDYKYLFPASAFIGVGLVVYCDTFARMILDPVELPVGIIMAALGGPFFLYLLRKGAADAS